MRDYEKSNAHCLSIVKFEAIVGCVQATECLFRTFAALRYLCRQGLVLRGHTIHTTCNTFGYNVKIIAWTFGEIREEIVAMTAHELVHSFSAEVRDKKSFVIGLLADEMADISRIEKLNICRRTVTLPADSFEVQKKLFGF